MEKILPKETYTQYKFDCPQCDWPWWATIAQLSHPQYIIVCYCGYCFKPILKNEHAKVIDNYSLEEKFNQIVQVLVLQGYSKKEAIYRVKKVYRQDKDIESLIKDAIFYSSTENSMEE